jgi:predicted RNA-binding Zn ribbon-like protein
MWSEANFIAGHPLLDFLNTVGDPGKSRRASILKSPTDLLSWIRASDLQVEVHVDIEPSQVVFEDIIDFRETVYSALVSMLENRSDQSSDIELVGRYLKNAIKRASFDMFSLPRVWLANQLSDHYYLDIFALRLDDLLRSSELKLLCQCERCTWLFLGSGRGRGRKWCSMATCGNRHKVELHRARSRDSA